MAWYKSGTVSVDNADTADTVVTGVPVITNSANLVTGTGTGTGTGANIQGAPGDIFEAYSDNSGKWYITRYTPFGGIKKNTLGAVSVTGGVGVNLASVALTPGKWKLKGTGQYYGSSASNTYTKIKISDTSTDISTASLGVDTGYFANDDSTGGKVGMGSLELDITLTANATYYLVAANRINTETVYGSLRAERIY